MVRTEWPEFPLEGPGMSDVVRRSPIFQPQPWLEGAFGRPGPNFFFRGKKLFSLRLQGKPGEGVAVGTVCWEILQGPNAAVSPGGGGGGGGGVSPSSLKERPIKLRV